MTRVRLRTLEELDEAAREIVESARRARISVAAVGGYAMQAYGSDRLTADLDIAVGRIPPATRAHAVRALAFGGVTIRTPSGVEIDLIDRRDELRPLYRAAVKDAISTAGMPIPVVRMTYLVAMKMASGREKDESDIMYLLGRMGAIELKATRLVVRKYLGLYAALELDALAEEARWRMSRDRSRIRRRRRF